MNEWIDAERHVARADELSESGQWDAAADELRQAVRKVPSHDDWQFHLGLALERIEQHVEAAKVFEEVLRLRGSEFESLLHLGINRLWSGDSKGAVAALERAEREDNDRHESFCYRIAAYAEMDMPDQGELMFYRAQQIGDDCPACYEFLGANMVRIPDLRRAAGCFQQALKLDPQRDHLHRLLGQIYWQLNELPLARHFFEEALRHDVTDPESLLSLGVLLAEAGQYAEATEKLRWSVEVQPDLTLGHLYLGELALMRGDIDAANARFVVAAKQDSRFPGVHAGLARVALARGDTRAACRHARAEMRSHDHSPGQRLDLGRLLLELDLPEDAIDVLDTLPVDVEEDEQLVRLLPEALLARGTALALAGELKEGVLDLRRAAALDPAHAVAAQSLGMVLSSLGYPRRAAAWLRRAERLDPANEEIRQLSRRATRQLALARLRHVVRRFFGR